MRTPARKPAGEEALAGLFSLLSQPTRIQVLLIIRRQPACVCHLVAALGLRQATISQHLMALSEAGLVTTRRDSRYIFYQLADERLGELIEQAAAVAGIPFAGLEALSRRPLANCPCPQCSPKAVIPCSSLSPEP